MSHTSAWPVEAKNDETPVAPPHKSGRQRHLLLPRKANCTTTHEDKETTKRFPNYEKFAASSQAWRRRSRQSYGRVASSPVAISVTWFLANVTFTSFPSSLYCSQRLP